MNRIRVQAVEPLTHLSARLKSSVNIHGQIMALYRFMEETSLFERISRRVEELTGTGDLEAAQESAQIWNTLMECLQQIVAVLGQTSQNSGELLKILRAALEQYALGTIPAVLDAVQFGSVDSMRGKEPKVLFILGANDGALPAGVSGNSLLTERERGILLREMNITLAPDSEGAMQRQLLRIYSAMTAPTEKLYVSYSVSAAGVPLRPSYLVGRLKSLFPKLEEKNVHMSVKDAMTVEGLTEQYLAAEESGDIALRESIRRAASEVPELENAIVSAKAASLPRDLSVPKALTDQIFGIPVALTASRLDALSNCPLSFFLNYGLKARPRREASFDAAEYGTFLHYILEQTVAEATRSGHSLPLSGEESAGLVEQYMKPYLETRMQDTEELSARQKYLYQRNSQEAKDLLTEITREFAVSEFRPCGYELKFGGGTKLGELTVQSALGRGNLFGTVDRVDLWRGAYGDYIRIVDYKSGTKQFDYTDLYGGVGLQLLLYLFALEKSGVPGAVQAPVPAGALYFPAKRGILSAEEPVSSEEAEKLRQKKGVKRTGLVLADDTVLEAMEHGGGGTFLPVKKSKSGLGDFAVTGEQMDLLEEFIHRRMRRAVDQIYSGGFAPAPFYRGPNHDPCQWCDYGDICQKDKSFRRQHYHPVMKASEFWEKIGGEDDA